jgi:glycogen synthase
LAVLEAAAHACALVLADIPPLRELWDDCALFVPAGDHEQWASTLDALAGDRQQRTTLANRARARSREFTPGRMAKSYLQLYRDLLVTSSVAGNNTTNLHEPANQTFLPVDCF